MLPMLQEQIETKKQKNLTYRKKTLNYLIIEITHVVCMMDAFSTYESFVTKIQLPMMLFALHKSNNCYKGDCDKH